MTERIPIATAEQIGKKHGYDQVIIVARRIGEPGLEWCTTWGKDKTHCDAAARIGDAIRDSVTPTIERLTSRAEEAEQGGAALQAKLDHSEKVIAGLNAQLTAEIAATGSLAAKLLAVTRERDQAIVRIAALFVTLAQFGDFMKIGADTRRLIEDAAKSGVAAGLRSAARLIADRRADYIAEHGFTDPETGVTEFPGNGNETVGEWDELEEAILGLVPGTPATLPKPERKESGAPCGECRLSAGETCDVCGAFAESGAIG